MKEKYEIDFFVCLLIAPPSPLSPQSGVISWATDKRSPHNTAPHSFSERIKKIEDQPQFYSEVDAPDNDIFSMRS